MKQKFFGFLFVSLIAVVLFTGGVTGVSVAEGVYLPLPGVSEYVYKSDFATKGLPKLSAINKNVEINFGKDNYLIYDGDTISGTGIGVFVRDNAKLPTNGDHFSQSQTDVGYVDHKNDWIVKPLSPVYTVIPVDNFSSYNVENDSGTWDTSYSIISPSTITLKYDKYMSDPYETIAVLYRKFDSNAWEILPGVVSAGSKTVTTTFDKNSFGSYCVANLDGNFNEFSGAGIPAVNWSQQYVTPLWAKGIMSQIRDSGYFGLVDGSSIEYNATRGEFASMLVKGLGLPLVSWGTDVFSDLTPALQKDGINYDNYYPIWRDYAYTSAKYGLFNGIRNGSSLEFQPSGYITREQAAALIARAAKLKLETDNEDGGKVDQGLEKLYKTDYTSINRWARPYVLAVSKAKYMEGFPNSEFKPTDLITRAQTAKIVFKLLKNLKLI